MIGFAAVYGACAVGLYLKEQTLIRDQERSEAKLALQERRLAILQRATALEMKPEIPGRLTYRVDGERKIDDDSAAGNISEVLEAKEAQFLATQKDDENKHESD